MNRSSITLVLVFSLVLTVGLSCSKQDPYQQKVERELSREGRNDSLFLGYHFGMTRQEFFDHSWALNRQKKVVQGDGNVSIRYEVNDLKYRAHKNFYPLFYQDSVYSMPVVYSYNGWAPWNREYWADSLKKDLLRKFKKEYPKEFVWMKHPERDDSAYVMVDKNKRISIYELDEQEVAVNYVDLTVLRRMENEK